MNILILITGSISVYKTCGLVSYLSKNHNVKVMMSKHATQFVTPLTFEVLSKNKVITDLFIEDNPERINHIYYAQRADIVIVAPATANIIGKVANGIGDDLISTTILASDKPVVFVPAMNTVMYNNPIVQDNIQKLKDYNYHIIIPEVKELACGVEGMGAYPDNRIITDYIKEELL